MSQYEMALRQYLSEFDGAKKDFSAVEDKFNALFHDKFSVTFEEGEDFSREDMKSMHAGFLTKGAKITLIHLRKIGLNCLDVKFTAQAEGEEDQTIHLVYTIEDEKIVQAQEVDSIGSVIKARLKSTLKVYQNMATFGTNM
mmetsp:Transcript_12758/g.21947  ORF Transcript_12758/g.21947 Transcript_12758/m.21947 type:complete len:141 (+) Transcript_12758:151-573(+)|eukprot:CAMPEP_0183771426 /NCGR_PEP_ID=MMETSP0739-20130205/32491_1 /TAXON_ID=385413 /ORGANISM="Thalassiosira miniscula, Strain CCMP1093" /LENGTH=140 /DNA_ID=CAMNT_0026011809 /DNA_START=149 /DNA_END=571 /DNA_ORIENTATION=+